MRQTSRISVWSNRNCSAWQTTGADARLSYNECRAEEKKILPRFGVYVCRINIDGKWYNGIGNVGVKPTVTEEHKRLVEVFVYDYEGDAYGKEITVEFCDFERPEIRFSSVNELKKQVAKDLRYGKDYFKASKEI